MATEPRDANIPGGAPIHRRSGRLDQWHDRLRDSRGAYVAAACLLTIAFVVLSVALGHHRRHDPRIILGDEPAHIDYALELRGGHVPAWGDRLNQTTLRVVACANQHTPGACRAAHRNPADAGASGFSYEAQQPPLGYLPYALTASTTNGPREGLLDVRRGGIIWTAAAGAVLLAFVLIEGLSLGALAVILAVTLMCPQFFEWAATVTNDAAGAFAGGLGLLAVALARRWRQPVAFSLGLATGLVLGLTKGLFVVVPAALVLQSLFLAAPWKRAAEGVRSFWKSGACALGMLAGTGAAYIGFVVVQDARSTTSPHTVLQTLLGYATTHHVHLQSIVGSFVGLTTVFEPLFVPDSASTALYSVWDLAVMGAVVGAIAIRRSGDDAEGSRALGLGILLAAVGLVVLWVAWWALQGYRQGTPARYAIPFCPLIGLLLVRSTSTKAMWTIGLLLPLAAAASQFGVQGY